MLIKLNKQAEMSRIINGIGFMEIEECILKGRKGREKNGVVSSFDGLVVGFSVLDKVHVVRRLVRRWFVCIVKGIWLGERWSMSWWEKC